MEDALFRIGPAGGPHPRLETLASELRVGRRYLLTACRDLTPANLQARPPAGTNSVGALLSHLAAAERLFQRLTSGRDGFDPDDEESPRAFRFAADPLAGHGLDAYVARLSAVRDDTHRLFAERDDGWLAEPRTFAGNASNVHYYWLHLLMDEARHTGQIILLRKYLLPGSDPAFDPYALR